MTKLDPQRWEKTRQMGRIKFIALFGGLWSLPFALLFSVLFPLATRHLMHDDLTFSKTLPVALPVSILGGIVFGIRLWQVGERDYENWKSTAKCDDSQRKT